MSIIERAAGKLGVSTPPIPPVIAPQPRDVEEENLIEKSIQRAEASFGVEPSFVPRDADEDGPATLIGSQQGHVNLARLRAMGGVTPDAGRSKIAEEYRLIKRPLLGNAFGHGGVTKIPNGNLIMVTSSVPSEGKTFSAINLAISMATELEHTVLLIDADVAKSSVPRYLGIEAERGLLDILRDPTVPLSDVLIKTDIAKLTILPSGRGFAQATELLAGAAMRAFVLDIASRYQDRIIIFDTPPILATSEATVLASYMGQIVFVVEAERTPQEAVKDALAHLSNCEHVGLILNKVPQRTGQSDYYGYGYGYGGYGEYSQQ
jgi:receptor protein-tyrosine kinase